MTSQALKARVDEVRRRCFHLLRAIRPTVVDNNGNCFQELKIGSLYISYDGILDREKEDPYSLEVDIEEAGEALYEIQHPTEYDQYIEPHLEQVNVDAEIIDQALVILRQHMVLDDLAEA